MNWQDFRQVETGKYGGIGILNHKYVCTRKIQSGMALEIRYISQSEFDSFTNWQEDESTWMELRCRSIAYLAFYQHSDFQEF